MLFRSSNLRKLMEIVDAFDTNVFQDERVRLFPAKNNLASDLVSELNSVFSGYGLSASATPIRFVPIERMNSILVITQNPSVFSEVEKWLARLDQGAVKAGIRNYVYRVKNAKAADIQGVLAQLYGGQVQVSSIYNLPSSNAGANPAQANQAPPAASNPMSSGAASTANASASVGKIGRAHV